MSSYLFFLGNNPLLATAEIEALFPRIKHDLLASGILQVTSQKPLRPSQFSRLGGTYKIARQLAPLSTDPASQLIDQIISNNFSTFSITSLAKSPNSPEAKEVKTLLKKQNFSSRFISPKSRSGLTPLVIDKQKATEFFTDSESIYQTIWTHDYQGWISRDRHRPYTTPRSGMLPPKLARILVNLAVGSQDPTSLSLLDPFCGTGAILIEAAFLGCSITGSDISPERIKGTKQNLHWAASQKLIPRATADLYVSDATHVSMRQKSPVDLIVTEPFLGPPHPPAAKIKNLARGLAKLYLGALKDWHQVLASQGKVVIILPQFNTTSGVKKTSHLIDRRENLGYNIVQRHLFTRPGAAITREILILTKN